MQIHEPTAGFADARHPGAVVFFHAHPDDESIFTGGTIRLLADRFVRTVVVIATSDVSEAAAAADTEAYRRAIEAHVACDLLGVDAVHHLGYLDAGIDGEQLTMGWPIAASLAATPVGDAAERLARILQAEQATALVTYDEGGIYAHPDHLAVHRIGREAAALAGVEVLYEATVDREYLHFVETHLVGHAVDWLIGEPAGVATNRAPFGVPTVMVSTTVDVRAALVSKRAAIAAHASQLPASAPLHQMDDPTFAAVYGYEWFIRYGPAGPIEDLGM
jgi:LmbE family N-acetylglucosaminyl deacetylase